MTDIKLYTGIGSRKTPASMLTNITNIAKSLDSMGYILRTGNAQGADNAFRLGTGKQTPCVYYPNPKDFDPTMWQRAKDIVSQYCTECDLYRMAPYVQNLLIRNMFQVTGSSLNSPTSMVICYSPVSDPCNKDGGGTRYACRYARDLNIPIYNLYNKRDTDVVMQIINFT